MTFLFRRVAVFLSLFFLFSCAKSSSLQKLQKVAGVSEVRGVLSLDQGQLLIFGKEPGKTDPIRGDLSRGRVVFIDLPDKMDPGTNTSRMIFDQIGDIISVSVVSDNDFYVLNKRLVVLEESKKQASVYQIFHTTNRGASWQVVTVTEPRDPGEWPHLDFADDQHGFLADNENWYRTRDGGKTWTLVKQSLPAGQLKKFVVLGENSLVYANDNHLIWADGNLVMQKEVAFEPSFRLVTLYRPGKNSNLVALGYDMEKKKHAPIHF